MDEISTQDVPPEYDRVFWENIEDILALEISPLLSPLNT